MKNEEKNSISEISNKENNYKFDNYGNVMADSIEDLLYDKYLGRKKPMEKSSSEKISKSNSSSITEKKEKDNDNDYYDNNDNDDNDNDDNDDNNNDNDNNNDITESQNINLQDNDEKSIKKNSNSSKEILDLINEDKKSENNDRFLDSFNQENENDNDNDNDININKNDEITENNEEFVNSLEKKNEYPEEEEQEDENGANNEIKLILNVNQNNDNINDKNSENNKFYKYNENSDEISKESNNNNRPSESTKVNSKKSKKSKKMKFSPSKNEGQKFKIIQDNNSKKLISNIKGIKDKNNLIIKLDLNVKDSKEKNNNFSNQLIPEYTKKNLSNVINNYYFCTKELKFNDDTYNSKYKEESDNYNNKNKRKYKNNDESDGNDNKNENNNDTLLNEKPKMYAELDLDKYNQPSNIKIRITNPYYHLFKNNKNIFKEFQTHSLEKMLKSKSTKDISDKGYHIKKFRKKNIEIIKLDKTKKLVPLKIKRKIFTNNYSINKYSTKNDFNFRNDNKTNVSDYKYFHNKEIYNAFEHKSRKQCEACRTILKQKREEEKKHIISNRKLDLKHSPSSRNIKNMKLFEPIYRKNNYFKEKNIFDKKNCYSSIPNKKRKNKKFKSSKKKKHSNKDSDTSSTNYANVINIEFPLLKSYFH